MSDPAALVPVPFYPPARIRAGNGGPFLSSGRPARRLPRMARPVQPAAPDESAGQVYDQHGLWVGESQLGWIVNIWA